MTMKTPMAVLLAGMMLCAAPLHANLEHANSGHANLEHVNSGHANSEHDEVGHDGTVYGTQGQLSQVTRTIDLTAEDYAFNQKIIKIKQGETIKFVLKNVGQEAHELTIGDAAMQLEHRKMMAAMPGMDHSKMSGHGHTMHGNSVSTTAGETKTLIWLFNKKGSFEFACNVPGHAELGMTGKIEVQ